MYVEPRMYVELYGPHFVRAFSQKNYEVTARARVSARERNTFHLKRTFQTVNDQRVFDPITVTRINHYAPSIQEDCWWPSVNIEQRLEAYVFGRWKMASARVSSTLDSVNTSLSLYLALHEHLSYNGKVSADRL
jgi:hypothetical protein